MAPPVVFDSSHHPRQCTVSSPQFICTPFHLSQDWLFNTHLSLKNQARHSLEAPKCAITDLQLPLLLLPPSEQESSNLHINTIFYFVLRRLVTPSHPPLPPTQKISSFISTLEARSQCKQTF
ncbi:hypothetical protein AVEN_166214-1 [Araneus ventricosus]|uniref:Uncharacterized protein n=1 Tax=Araneus ventricosus TaxID=182803 RepID=A0A4Y2DL79_ARAVE|nr:hypothetical protein AVEN_230393-1 [Araneus ventricosus]GBM16588.1 hypothetical protein AVEN_261348-1 [Araneus ventricosus]GBM16614.1 hypothetical protein AVEN_273862-1 [Araneus ventricosus]GBM16720.1 hypothetical protein AVEN_166214-1 [Araneus ventricosus]